MTHPPKRLGIAALACLFGGMPGCAKLDPVAQPKNETVAPKSVTLPSGEHSVVRHDGPCKVCDGSGYTLPLGCDGPHQRRECGCCGGTGKTWWYTGSSIYRVPNNILAQQIAIAPHIQLAERFEAGDKIVAEFVGEALPGAEAKYDWTFPKPVGFEATEGGRRQLLWAKPAKKLYPVELAVTYTIDILAPDPADPTKGIPKKLTLPPYHYSDAFEVVDPQPPAPEKTLAELAGKDAPALASMLQGLKTAPTTDGPKLLAYYDAQLVLRHSKGLLIGTAAEAPIRVTLAETVGEGEFEPADLATCIDGIVAELKVPPPDPDPDPTPSPAPIPVAGLHVLIVSDTDPEYMASLSDPQRAALQSTLLKEYVLSKGGQYRNYDPDSSLGNDSQVWRDAMARPRTATPWIIVSNAPKGGYEGPLVSLDDALALARKWGE